MIKDLTASVKILRGGHRARIAENSARAISVIENTSKSGVWIRPAKVGTNKILHNEIVDW